MINSVLHLSLIAFLLLLPGSCTQSAGGPLALWSALFQFAKQPQGLLAAGTANFRFCFELIAYPGSGRIIKDQAAIVPGEMDAGNTCRFTTGHAGYGGGNGWSNATGSAMFTAFHKKREWLNHPQVTKNLRKLLYFGLRG